MTPRKKTTKPSFYVFKRHECPMVLVGVLLRHTTGKGYNLIIGDDRYTAVPPRATQATTTAPDLYVFKQHQCRMVLVGAMFKHTTGKGYNLFVQGACYTAIPPRAKQPEPEGSA